MRRLIGLVAGTALIVVSHSAQAIELRVGPRIDYGTSSELGIGPRVEVGLEDLLPGLRIAADLRRYFDSNEYSDVDGLEVDSSSWDFGAQVLYDFATIDVLEGATLYAGAGAVYTSQDYDRYLTAVDAQPDDAEIARRYAKLKELGEKYADDSGFGLTLALGSAFKTGWTVTPFVEAQYTFGVVDQLAVSIGILFSTGAAAP